jgi:hypothetical protein
MDTNPNAAQKQGLRLIRELEQMDQASSNRDSGLAPIVGATLDDLDVLDDAIDAAMDGLRDTDKAVKSGGTRRAHDAILWALRKAADVARRVGVSQDVILRAVGQG